MAIECTCYSLYSTTSQSQRSFSSFLGFRVSLWSPVRPVNQIDHPSSRHYLKERTRLWNTHNEAALVSHSLSSNIKSRDDCEPCGTATKFFPRCALLAVTQLLKKHDYDHSNRIEVESWLKMRRKSSYKGTRDGGVTNETQEVQVSLLSAAGLAWTPPWKSRLIEWQNDDHVVSTRVLFFPILASLILHLGLL